MVSCIGMIIIIPKINYSSRSVLLSVPLSFKGGQHKRFDHETQCPASLVVEQKKLEIRHLYDSQLRD